LSEKTAEWVRTERQVLLRNMKYVLAISVWTIIVYKDIYKARFFLDDYLHLHLVDKIDNPLLPYGTDIMMGAFFRPGVFWFWKINYLLGGLNPAWYYAFNIVLLIGILALIMQVMQHLTGNKGIAAFVTLSFAVSPITAQGVLWLSNRFDLLGTFFLLASLLLFLRFLRLKQKRDISWSMALGVFSFFCKEITIVLPALLIFSGSFMFYYRGTLTRSTLRRIVVLSIPYFIAAAAFMMWRYAILGTMGGYVGEQRVAFTWEYAFRLIASFGEYVWLFHTAIGLLLFVFVFSLFLLKRKILKRNLIWLYGLGFFIVSAAPLAMVLKVEKVMLFHTPRFFFLPGLGLAICLAAVYEPRAGRLRRALAVCFIIAMTALSSINTYVVTRHARDQTISAEQQMEKIHEFLVGEKQDLKNGPIIYACLRNLDIALDSSIKLMHPEYRSEAFILNCATQTQIIAYQDLYKLRKEELEFPKTFTKNPSQFRDLFYGVVVTKPNDILSDVARKKDHYALYTDRDGGLTWVTSEYLLQQMETMGLENKAGLDETAS
jgi:hypothetical protein